MTRDEAFDALGEAIDEVFSNPHRAIQICDNILKLHPHITEVLTTKALALEKLKMSEAASALYDDAVSFNPNYYTALISRAIYNYKKGNFEKAIPDLEKAFLNNEDPERRYESLLYLADCFLWIGDLDKARLICDQMPEHCSFPGFRWRVDGSKDDILRDIERKQIAQASRGVSEAKE